MNEQNALKHTCAWAIQHIFDLNKEAKAILEDKDLSEAQRLERLRGPSGVDYRLLNIILLMRPFRDHAQQYFPEQDNFFAWFDERCAFIDEQKYVTNTCGCLGCDPERKIIKQEVAS